MIETNERHQRMLEKGEQGCVAAFNIMCGT